jgi:DNA-binding HxlR family transcriptional regulator
MVLDHIGSRWGVLILTALHGGPMRFSALREKIEGISEKMLSQTLRTLTRDGLVYRQVEPSAPPAVSYGLTPLGAGLAGHMQDLFDWLRANADQVIAHQNTADSRAHVLRLTQDGKDYQATALRAEDNAQGELTGALGPGPAVTPLPAGSPG